MRERREPRLAREGNARKTAQLKDLAPVSSKLGTQIAGVVVEFVGTDTGREVSVLPIEVPSF